MQYLIACMHAFLPFVRCRLKWLTHLTNSDAILQKICTTPNQCSVVGSTYNGAHAHTYNGPHAHTTYNGPHTYNNLQLPTYLQQLTMAHSLTTTYNGPHTYDNVHWPTYLQQLTMAHILTTTYNGPRAYNNLQWPTHLQQPTMAHILTMAHKLINPTCSAWPHSAACTLCTFL